MAERAGLFEGADFDVSAFTPKKTPQAEPPAENIRAVAETANFQSREPIKAKMQRRRRTGRNLQLNLKVDAATRESLYAITDRQGYTCLGETLERALAALQRELSKNEAKTER
jgi:hypothetical protein